jgi:ribosome-binding factor A
VPKLKFILDTTLDHSERINELLKKVDLGDEERAEGR